MVSLLARLVLSLFGASVCAAFVAAVEAQSTLAAAHDAALPSRGTLWLVDLGLLAPLAWGVGLAVGAALVVLEPGEPKTLGDRARALRAEPVLMRARTAALLPLVCFSAFTWTVVMAHAARAELAFGAPLRTGVRLALEGAALAGLLGITTLALLPTVRRLLAYGAELAARFIDPVTTLLVAVVGCGLLFAAGIGSGDTGGDGPGPLAIFGVLKRPELDLRPAMNLLVVVLGAYLAPHVFAQRRSPWALLLLAGGLALSPVGFTVRAAHLLNDDGTLARVLERDPPLGKVGLKLLRKLTDRDRDGASGYFGGGDCDDHDKRRSPLSTEIPGNGIDEDCSGADDEPLAPEAAPSRPDPEVERGPNPFPEGLNLLLITIDTLRTDVGFMGYPEPITPNLDKLAAESVVFDAMHAFASYTGKSVGPLLIGKYPSETLRDGGHFNRYESGNVFIAERLKAAGFRTFGGGAHWYFGPGFGLTQGMDAWDMSAKPAGGQGDNDTTITSDALANAAIRLLSKEENVSGRFFGWFHFVDPHAQYVPHPGAPDFAAGKKGYGAAMRAAYDGEVWFTDKHVGRILDFVRAQPWGARTAVVVTADHGEAFAEHGMNWHGFEIWEVLVRVPFVVYVPGLAPHRVAVKRSHIDLVPTILDVLHVDAPEGELSGQSLRADLVAKSGAGFAERDVYVDMPDGPYTHMRRALITGPTPGMKIVHAGGGLFQLYDLAEDPGELHDLARDKAKLGPMTQALSRFRSRLREIEVKAEVPAPR